jgi:hypothetical protein
MKRFLFSAVRDVLLKSTTLSEIVWVGAYQLRILQSVFIASIVGIALNARDIQFRRSNP